MLKNSVQGEFTVQDEPLVLGLRESSIGCHGELMKLLSSSPDHKYQQLRQVLLLIVLTAKDLVSGYCGDFCIFREK